MKTFRLFRMWGIGAALFVLRFLQNKNDFDSETLLHTLSPVGITLSVLIAVSIVAALLFSLRESRERPVFSEHFAAPTRSLPLLIAGSFLLLAGGGLLSFTVIPAPNTHSPLTAANAAALFVGILAAISGLFFLLLTRKMRHLQTVTPVYLIPAMAFAALWVLALYLPSANDPVLARYCLPILAAAAAAYAFSQLTGFLRCETRVRTFCAVSECAVALCLGAAAELNIHSLLYLGCAMLLTAFTSLQTNR